MTNDNKLSEHEKLKEIIDLIGFDILKIKLSIEYTKFYGFHIDGGELYWKTYDVREIIFTQEFMDKFRDYKPLANVCCILNNLDNPVDYLFNLIKE